MTSLHGAVGYLFYTTVLSIVNYQTSVPFFVGVEARIRPHVTSLPFFLAKIVLVAVILCTRGLSNFVQTPSTINELIIHGETKNRRQQITSRYF